MQAIKAEGAGLATRMQPKSVSRDVIALRPGAVMGTGRDMDVAMNEQAVLGVTTRDGKLAFTRRGDLQVTASGVLQNGSGFVVRGEGGQPITVPTGSKVSITAFGVALLSFVGCWAALINWIGHLLAPTLKLPPEVLQDAGEPVDLWALWRQTKDQFGQRTGQTS